MNVTIKCSKCSQDLSVDIERIAKLVRVDKDFKILCDCGNVMLEDGKFVRQVKEGDSVG